MNAIATTIQSLLKINNTVLPWENIPTHWQQNIHYSSINTRNPSCIVYPETQNQLANIMQIAKQHQWRVLPCGSGSKINWGGLTTDVDIVVSTERINQLIEHAVGDLTITVEAGIKFSEIQEILAKHQQTLALDPTFPDHATIGGIVATADTGSLRQRYGSVRDQLLGITFIRADGEIAKAGGRVVKNVAGYDLMKLFTGSYGTLGIISQVTFRVYPLPETSSTIILTGNKSNIAQAIKTLQASELTPTKADLLSHQIVANLGLGNISEDKLGLICQFASIHESVQEQIKRLSLIGEKLELNRELYSNHEEINLWKQLSESIYQPQQNSVITCKIGVLSTAAIDVMNNIEFGLIHLSSGLGVVRLENETQIVKLRKICQENYGFLTILSAPVELKTKVDIWGYNGNALAVMQRIKNQFDSDHILSHGRFLGEI